jgi:hypothetical protein
MAFATKDFKQPSTEVKVDSNQMMTIREILRGLKDPKMGKAMINGVEPEYAPCSRMVKIIMHQDSGCCNG